MSPHNTVQKTIVEEDPNTGVTVRSPQTFGHIVYVLESGNLGPGLGTCALINRLCNVHVAQVTVLTV